MRNPVFDERNVDFHFSFALCSDSLIFVSLDPVRTRSDYDAAIEAVGAVINAWDAYRLLAGGAPRDEFDAEVARLVARIPHIHSSADAAGEISAVFSAAFGPQRFTVEACADVGAQLYDRLQSAGLLSTHGV